jgi:prepilin-type processing-associated H-X9-DG protein/prepilin-type N-terminal cleavage/methylation domain-containing protein
MRRCQSAKGGFTLVELLVVVGVIAALLAMLLPTVTRARQSAQQLQCEAKIQQILTIMQDHVLTHHGYAPLVGVLNVAEANSTGLNDPSREKYDYLSFQPYGIDDPLMGFDAALARDLGDPRILAAQNIGDLDAARVDPLGFLKYFRCPANLPDPGPLHGPALYFRSPAGGSGILLAWLESQSYIYNEAALGWDDSMNRKRGQVSKVRLQSQTMVMADGLGGGSSRSLFGYTFSTVYNKVPIGPVTLADALAGNGSAGDPQNFDAVRHNGRMNIGFFDGHVETRNISGNDLMNVYLMPPE